MPHDAVDARLDDVLHLHRLQHDQRLARRHVRRPRRRARARRRPGIGARISPVCRPHRRATRRRRSRARAAPARSAARAIPATRRRALPCTRHAVSAPRVPHDDLTRRAGGDLELVRAAVDRRRATRRARERRAPRPRRTCGRGRRTRAATLPLAAPRTERLATGRRRARPRTGRRRTPRPPAARRRAAARRTRSGGIDSRSRPRSSVPARERRVRDDGLQQPEVRLHALDRARGERARAASRSPRRATARAR